MDHQERVFSAIRHLEPDRVPIGEWLIDRSLMAKILKKSLRDFDPFEDTVQVCELLGLDIKGVDCTFEPSPYKEVVGTSQSGRPIVRDGWGAIYEESEFGSLTASLIEPPIKNPEDVYTYQFPPLSYYERNAREVERWVQETDLCIAADVWGGRGMITPLMGYENYMVWSVTHPEELEFIIRRFTAYNAEIAKMYVDAGAHIIVVDDDIAGNQGPFMSPEFYRRVLFPALREEVAAIKKHAERKGRQVFVFFHSDGDITTLLDDLISLGIDGLHPLEPAAGVDLGWVKERYGDKLCLMDNIDTREILPYGRPEDVEREVRRVIQQAAYGGGLILASANMLTADVPVENVFAIREAVQKWGYYNKGRG
ncbi:MAG: uroporphyrinogen decarboxylase family protein [Candidatus Methanomethylicaceae archaeon]